jgi:hypothetical protein
MKKKQWHKPQLIVLVRSKPGEAILAACKGSENGGTGPTAEFGGCFEIVEENGFDGHCSRCHVHTPS